MDCGLGGVGGLGMRPVSAAWPVLSGSGPGVKTLRRVNLHPYGMSLRSFFWKALDLTSFGFRFANLILLDVAVIRCWRPTCQCIHQRAS